MAALYERYRSHPDSEFIVSAEVGMALYYLVRKCQPLVCVEMGTGIGASTGIIAQAMEDNDRGLIYTIEHDPRLMAIAQDLLPTEARSRVIQIQSEVAVKVYNNGTYVCYKSKPIPEKIDLVVIDGPPELISLKGADPRRFVCGDILEIVPRLNSKAKIFVDGRLLTVELLSSVMEWDSIDRYNTGGPGHTILEMA